MEYKIQLKSIKLFGHHGVLPEEKHQGQDFFIDIVYKYKKEEPQDEIEAAIDYSAVYATAQKVFSAKQYDLLESLSQDIASAIIEQFPVSRVKVSVSKNNPPVGGEVAKVTVSTKLKK